MAFARNAFFLCCSYSERSLYSVLLTKLSTLATLARDYIQSYKPRRSGLPFHRFCHRYQQNHGTLEFPKMNQNNHVLTKNLNIIKIKYEKLSVTLSPTPPSGPAKPGSPWIPWWKKVVSSANNKWQEKLCPSWKFDSIYVTFISQVL